MVHYTGTEASAHNNLLYFSREPAGASAHYFIDRDGTIRQSVSEGGTAWHAGHWATNLCSVGIDDFARRVINGEFGNGDARRNSLGDNYAAVQARVNEMLGCGGSAATGGGVDIESLVWAVINGDYGNGDERR